MGQLYTIGHSTYPTEHFIELLSQFQVDYLLDVRSIPFSQFTPQYNGDILPRILKQAGISYASMGKYFGARQSDKKYYNEEGYLDFEIFRASELFQKGKENVKRGLVNHNIVLMCTEKEPIDCHRAIMVARGFELDGVDVKHIVHSFEAITQDELNKSLLNLYFPDRYQYSLFAEDNKDDAEYIREAYRMRNSEIGYRPDENREGAVA